MIVTIRLLQNLNIKACCIGILLTAITPFFVQAQQPVEKHGQLSVLNGKVVDQYNNAVSLAGPSLFWSNNNKEGEKFFSATTVKTVSEQWNASIIRAAMAAQGEGSYLTNPLDNQRKVETVIDAAIKENIYVIVDWHSHHAQDNIDQAIAFFTAIATKYKKHPHIIYEIYNEPLRDTDWSTVIKPYAEQVINAIRAIDKNNLIIVGTQSWSQDVDKAALDPIVGVSNIVYSLHFYAGTHKDSLRKRAQQAINSGLALFVSEWGTVNANGDGDIDKKSTQAWLDFIKANKLSHCSWSITNKDEGSAMIKPNTTTLGNWSDDELTANGIYLKNIIKQWQE